MSLIGRLSVVGAGRPAGALPAEELLRAARRERTLPVVGRNLGLSLPEERDILARQIVAGAQAREVAERVPALPLKGLHLAHRVYPSPALRDMGDLDLLVRPADLGEADRVLRGLGYRPDRPPVRGGGTTLNAVVYSRDEGLPLHLHWRVSNASLPHRMIRIDEGEIWREARDGAMAPHHLLVTLCEHALKHSYDALVHLTDIELVARDADWPRVAGVARRWGLDRAVAYALLLLRDVLGVRSAGLSLFEGFARGLEGGALLAMARARRSRGVSTLGLMSMSGGVSGRLGFVRDALAPEDREGLRTRSVVGRAARALGALLG